MAKKKAAPKAKSFVRQFEDALKTDDGYVSIMGPIRDYLKRQKLSPSEQFVAAVVEAAEKYLRATGRPADDIARIAIDTARPGEEVELHVWRENPSRNPDDPHHHDKYGGEKYHTNEDHRWPGEPK